MNRTIPTAVALLAIVGAGAVFTLTATPGGARAATNDTMHSSRAERMQMHLDKLKAQLKITSGQESAWNGFTQALTNMHPEHSGMESKMKHEAMSMSAPELFSDMVDHAQDRVARAQQLAKAGNKLYGQLSSEQRGAFNMALAMMHAKMHKMMHKMQGMRGMHGAVGGHG